jgi:hypothetical protein
MGRALASNTIRGVLIGWPAALEARTRWIDVVATGQSAQVRARLPVRWTWNP